MKREYKDLVKVRVLHEYYSNRISHDLTFLPIPSTQKKLAGHGLLFKQNNESFKVVYAVENAGNPFIPIHPGQHFSFVIHRQNPGFFNFTKIPERKGFISYFTNRKYDLEEIKTDHSLFGSTKHLYHYFADRATISSMIDLDPLTYQNSEFGYVQLFKQELSQPYYSISFETQSKIWKYFVVLPKGTESSEYDIQKKNNQPPNSRYASLQISFLERQSGQLEDGRKVLSYESGSQGSRTGVYNVEGQPIEGTPSKGLIDCPKKVAIPIFHQKAKPSIEYLEVSKRKERTTDHYTFKRIILNEGSTLTFTREWVSIHELICKGQGATIKFKQDTKLYIRDKLELGTNCKFNPDSKELLCLVGKKDTSSSSLKVRIGKGSIVNGVIFTFGALELKSVYHQHDDDDDDDDDEREGPKHAGHLTKMNGVFIAGKIKGQTHAQWNLVRNTWDNPNLNDAVEVIPIPFYEEKLLNLQLIKKTNKHGQSTGTSIVYGNLPNPSINDLKPELFIYL